MINVHIVKKRMEFGAWWMFRHIPREKENIPIVSIEKKQRKITCINRGYGTIQENTHLMSCWLA